MIRIHLSRAGRPAAVRRRMSRGFTLVELMVTVAVAAILMAIAIPSFKTITVSNQLDAAANDVVNALNTARMQAIKRNADTQMCSNNASNNGSDTLGGGCASVSGPTGAVIQVIAGTPTSIQSAITSVNTPIKLNGDLVALRFSGNGLAHLVGGTGAPFGSTVVDICTSAISSSNHRIISMAAGSIVSTTSSTGACP
jgi:type IV fimbrial biogenesis protein FimT